MRWASPACAAAVIVITLSVSAFAAAQELPRSAVASPTTQQTTIQLPDLSSRDNLGSTIQLVAVLSVLSLAPAILLMVTSFTRIIIVLSLLRQALGAQQLPPNQVLVGLSMFMTFLVMAPTWERVNGEALQPYMNGEMDQRTALARAQVPVREFMLQQIARSGNEEDIFLFHE